MGLCVDVVPGSKNVIDKKEERPGSGDGRCARELLADISKAKELVAASKPKEAIAILEPLLGSCGVGAEMNGPRALMLAYIASAYQLLGNIEKSLAHSKSALELSGRTGVDQVTKGEVYYVHGTSLRIKGDQKECLVYLTRALALFEACHDNEAIGRTCRAIGSALLNSGLYAKSLAYLMRSLKIYEEMGDRNSLNGTLNNIALSKGFQGMNEEALKDYDRLLELGVDAQDDRQVATVCVNIGHFNNRLQRWDTALEHYKKAETVALRVGDRRLSGFIAFGKAEALAGKGQLEEAARTIDASFKDTTATKSDEAMAWTLRARGIISRERGDLRRAQDDFALAEKVLGGGAFDYLVTRIYIEWGKTLVKAGDMNGAKAMFEKARKIYKRNRLALLEKELDMTIKGLGI